MSGGRGCRCSERKAPLTIDLPSNDRVRQWAVLRDGYRCNHSAFNGYKETYSEYSAVTCLVCGAIWRTKAAYVDAIGFTPGGWTWNFLLLPTRESLGLA